MAQNQSAQIINAKNDCSFISFLFLFFYQGFIIPQGMDVSLPSIFHNANIKLEHIQHTLSHPCEQFDVSVSKSGEIYFGLVTETNSLLSVLFEEGKKLF